MPAERILVVDDEETIREIVSSMLTHANYKCRQAASGLEAIALLDSGEEFELMLSDLMMADLDGIGLLERTKERFPDMPVVMVTAVHDISVALAAIRNGAYDYLLKPFEREQLLATVRRAMENRRLKLENRAYQTNLETLVAARNQEEAGHADVQRYLGQRPPSPVGSRHHVAEQPIATTATRVLTISSLVTCAAPAKAASTLAASP